MKFIIFRSSKGDCLLISHPDSSTNKQTNILVDGGMSGSFKEWVAPYLHDEIREKGEEIDLLCVSHIDDDHIVGVLTFMEILTQWRVYDYHQSQGNNHFKRPAYPRVPEINAIWHNSFAKTYDLGAALPRIEQALHEIEQMTVLHLEKDELLEEVYHKAASIRKAVVLSQHIRPELLGIPLNPEYDKKLVKCNQRTISKNIHPVGDMSLTVLGPFTSDLNELKKNWIKWEEEHQATLADYFGDLNLTALTSKVDNSVITQLLLNGGSIKDYNNRRGVSVPNLASIMFLLEADGNSILMTGDGHGNDILKGLKKNKKLRADDSAHVNILKIQHHGAIANINDDFCKQVTADHYVFCGNGTHHNPEIDVLEFIFNSRRGTAGQKSENPEVNDTFEFWFSVHPDESLTVIQRKHIKKIETKLKEFIAIDKNTFEYHFMRNEGWQEIQL